MGLSLRNLADAFRTQSAIQNAYQGQVRHGLVTAVDPKTHSVKVTLQPEGVVTGWLPDPGLACSGLRIACPCEVGTQVLTLPVEADAEHPVIVARLFDTTVTPPISPGTGSVVQPGEVGFFLSNGNYLHLSSSGIFMKGDVTVDGSIKTTGDVTAKTVSLQTHVHTGVTSGSDLTGHPQAAQ